MIEKYQLEIVLMMNVQRHRVYIFDRTNQDVSIKKYINISIQLHLRGRYVIESFFDQNNFY